MIHTTDFDAQVMNYNRRIDTVNRYGWMVQSSNRARRSTRFRDLRDAVDAWLEQKRGRVARGNASTGQTSSAALDFTHG